MKTIYWLFILTVLISLVQPGIFSNLSNHSLNGSAFASTGLEDNTSKNKDSKQLEEVDRKYQQKINYIIIIVFAVLFIICMYWWTYGKLHHKLPHY